MASHSTLASGLLVKWDGRLVVSIRLSWGEARTIPRRDEDDGSGAGQRQEGVALPWAGTRRDAGEETPVIGMTIVRNAPTRRSSRRAKTGLSPLRARAPRPRRQWRRRVARQWRHGIALDPLLRPPKGVSSLWTRVRAVLWSWWPWFIVSLSAALADRWPLAFSTGTMAFVSHLLGRTEHSPRFGLDHEFTVDREEFLSTMTGATGAPLVAGNRLDILQNGDEFYPAMFREIAHARASITIEAYIYWAGDIGARFARALAGKAQEGVAVKILLDAVGSSSIGSDILKTLEAGGCQLAWYNRIRWYRIGRFNHRTHRKSLIVDGRVGFTGGAGIADVWVGHAQSPLHWRDTQVRIEGPAVTPLQTGFAQNWLQTTGELVSGPRFYPTLEPAGRVEVQTIMSSPETGASSVRIMHYLSIVCARRSIFIANPYFVPDQAARDTLIEARRRGVDVRIMVAGLHNDTWLARANSVRLYGSLLEAGVEILEYNRTMLHQKTMVVDGQWVTIGTTNFDTRSFAHNEESSICFRDAELAVRLERAFKADIEGCIQVELESWRKRGLLRKSLESVASLFEAQV
jgi:cardiolipin synthase